MNIAHIHIIINHLPIVGQFFSVLLLMLGFYYRDQEGVIISAALVMIISGFGALAAYFSGSPSVRQIAALPGVGHKYINIHFKRARIATILSVIGALTAAFCGSVVFSQGAPAPAYCFIIMFIIAAITSGFMIFTGNAGGHIRHQEVRRSEKK